MWIAADSAFLYPILIEIETPSKRWFYQDVPHQHSELTTGLNQLRQWKGWFSRARNQVAFYEMYRIPRDLQDLTLTPRYVLVHGRRKEANQSPAFLQLRAQLAKEDERLVTFDHLEPDPQETRYFTVSVDEHGFTLVHLPTELSVGELPDDVMAEVRGLRDRLRKPGQGEPDSPHPGYRFKPPTPGSKRRRRHRGASDR
jgi:hypothetical protein